jgi:hypothetical protein
VRSYRPADGDSARQGKSKSRVAPTGATTNSTPRWRRSRPCHETTGGGVSCSPASACPGGAPRGGCLPPSLDFSNSPLNGEGRQHGLPRRRSRPGPLAIDSGVWRSPRRGLRWLFPERRTGQYSAWSSRPTASDDGHRPARCATAPSGATSSLTLGVARLFTAVMPSTQRQQPMHQPEADDVRRRPTADDLPVPAGSAREKYLGIFYSFDLGPIRCRRKPGKISLRNRTWSLISLAALDLTPSTVHYI